VGFQIKVLKDEKEKHRKLCKDLKVYPTLQSCTLLLLVQGVQIMLQFHDLYETFPRAFRNIPFLFCLGGTRAAKGGRGGHLLLPP
jgi:hypothetical protein